ncbi:MAG: tRNA pseudouridine13 synthase [Pseudohongiellaceae bacterium]|jgi:tRNA pseudouridine13 synthase
MTSPIQMQPEVNSRPQADSLGQLEARSQLDREPQVGSQSQVVTRARRPQYFPTVYPSLELSAKFRSAPEDFVVHENLGFSPSNNGEHCLIHIEKIGQNTHWVAEQLALLLKLDSKAVGYCGRKDRHAVTRQWLSIYDPHRNIDFSDELGSNIGIDGVKLLETTRHSHKLRPGDHQSNHFYIRLRDVKRLNHSATEDGLVDDSTNGTEGIGELLEDSQKPNIINAIKQRFKSGIPNYFGPQRFGRGGNNLLAAGNWFEGKQPPPRKQKSMVMSAARSYLFNKVLAVRIQQNCWASAIDGDVLIDAYPTAPLWGRGRLTTQVQALELETTALEGLNDWCHGLEHCGLKQERRATVLHPTQVSVTYDDDDLVIAFDLISGAFATSVLAEVCTLEVAHGVSIEASLKSG